MPSYEVELRVSGTWSDTETFTVQAETEQEAIELAEDEALATIFSSDNLDPDSVDEVLSVERADADEGDAEDDDLFEPEEHESL